MKSLVLAATYFVVSVVAQDVQVPFLQPLDPYGLLDKLGPTLSRNASVLLPTSATFDKSTSRWSPGRNKGTYVGAVEVATEEDVQLTIRFANTHGLPFFAQTGGHGIWSGVGQIKDGILINMRRMNSVKPEEKKATIGGGALVKEVVDTLYNENKRAQTGVCECVGAIGPILGGGHGLLQGQYGLGADNLLSARIVLANGTAVTASSEENQDLFWAVRGAGHNFGIITSFELKIYDAPQDDTWTLVTLIFSNNKLEDIFDLINIVGIDENHPDHVSYFVIFANLPAFGKEPSLILNTYFHGQTAEAWAQVSSFIALEPLVRTAESLGFNHLANMTGIGKNDLNCQTSYDASMWPSNLQTYNVTALRKVYQVFAELTSHEQFARSGFMLESYPTRGVRAVDEKTTAVSKEERSTNFIMSPVLIWELDNTEMAKQAHVAGEEMRRLVDEGRDEKDWPPHSYLSYGHGDESLERLYGYDEWRLEKLRKLKAEYDPKNRFGFLAPLA